MAVIRLAKAVVGVTPRPLCRSLVPGWGLITVVGFGRTHRKKHDYGLKRWGLNVISWAADDHFFARKYGGDYAQVCYGDSGGPAFVGECVAGVSSRLWFPACKTKMRHERVDAYVDWITEVADDPSIKSMTPEIPEKGDECNWKGWSEWPCLNEPCEFGYSLRTGGAWTTKAKCSNGKVKKTKGTMGTCYVCTQTR